MAANIHLRTRVRLLFKPTLRKESMLYFPGLYRSIAVLRTFSNSCFVILNKLNTKDLHCKPILPRRSDFLLHQCQCITTSIIKTSSSHSDEVIQDEMGAEEYLKHYEPSYKEFESVEQLLPPLTVPEITEHAQYPTPSGWFPANKSLQAVQKYVVRRTKNHMLPVYLETQQRWYGITHFVTIKKIEGDIWALEAELRDHITNTAKVKSLNTQVHEVGRFIRVRGQFRDLIAQYLLKKGM